MKATIDLPDQCSAHRARLNAELNKALAQADVKSLMDRAGLMQIGGSADQFAATIKADVERLQKIVKAAGIVPE